jgi:hypothetical protein
MDALNTHDLETIAGAIRIAEEALKLARQTISTVTGIPEDALDLTVDANGAARLFGGDLLLNADGLDNLEDLACVLEDLITYPVTEA